MVGRPKVEVRDRGRGHNCCVSETFAIVQQVEDQREEEHCPIAEELQVPQVRWMVGCAWGGRNESKPKAPAGIEGEARLVRRGRRGRGQDSHIAGADGGTREQVLGHPWIRTMLGLPPRMSYRHQKR